MFTIGCHLSASKGFLDMAQTALSIGANTFQFFTRNPRGGQAKAIDPDDIRQFHALAEENGISVILAHAPYVLNACAAKDDIRNFARETMADDLQRMEHVPGNYYNFHPGSHVQQGIDIGIQKIAGILNDVLFREQQTTVLLETMAGKGSEVGRTFEELHDIMEKVQWEDKLGVCLDTCHVNDAGYDLNNNLDDVLTSFDKIIGLDRLKAVHLNDSKNPLGSHKDRHELIGKGTLGETTIRRIINHPVLRDLPFFLETPNDISGYQKEIQLLKSWREER
ncbi:MAG: deoxyribonuclease IV [Paludibacteraceae bacterium]|nr:deoxyribonuclease IV [Paludibacteraceae bacterium]MCR5298293.1 deoxyribonuclease IV [Paludibacteraceae bacterium]